MSKKRHNEGRRRFVKGVGAVGGSALLGTTGAVTTQLVRAAGHSRVTYGMGTVPTSADTMDPVYRTSGSDGIYNAAVYEALVHRDPSLTPRPVLAESWSANATGTEWTFKLREATFHNGKPFVAADVVSSYKRLLDPDTGSPGASNLAAVDPDGIVAVNDRTVRFKLTEPDVDFPNTTVFSQNMIAPEGSGPELSTNPIGTGPFKADGFTPGEISNRFVRHENYWNPGKPGVDELDIVGIGEREARVAALLSGQIDIAAQLNPASLGSLEGNSDYKIINNNVGTSTIAYCQTDTAPFDNNDLRLAIKYATNRQQMLDLYYQGRGALMNDTPIPGFIFGGLETIRERSLAKAKEHLDKAGYPNGIDLTFEYAKYTNEDQWATIWQAGLAEAGIRLTLEQRPTDGYWGDVWLQDGHPFAYSGWNVRPTHAALGLWYVSTASWNESRFKSETFDANYAKAKATVNDAERIKLYHACIKEVQDHAGHFVPFIQAFMDGTSSKVNGWTPTAGSNDFGSIVIG
jgi:peptide/nickel transport system substrate-binding protein